jgi:hypothetical protein
MLDPKSHAPEASDRLLFGDAWSPRPRGPIFGAGIRHDLEQQTIVILERQHLLGGSPDASLGRSPKGEPETEQPGDPESQGARDDRQRHHRHLS